MAQTGTEPYVCRPVSLSEGVAREYGLGSRGSVSEFSACYSTHTQGSTKKTFPTFLLGHRLNAVSLDGLRKRLATGKKAQPQLAGAHARLGIHVLGILNHALLFVFGLFLFLAHSPNALQLFQRCQVL